MRRRGPGAARIVTVGARARRSAPVVAATLAVATLLVTGCADPSLPTTFPPAHATDHPVPSDCGTRAKPTSPDDPPATDHEFQALTLAARRALPTVLGGDFLSPDLPAGKQHLHLLVTNVGAAQRVLATMPKRYCHRIELFKVPNSINALTIIQRRLSQIAARQGILLDQMWVDRSANRVEIEVPVHPRQCFVKKPVDPWLNYRLIRNAAKRYAAAVVIRAADRECYGLLEGPIDGAN
jgi:hypothetical protein